MAAKRAVKGEKKQRIEDVIEDMFRPQNKAREVLEKRKEMVDPRTKQVKARDYGYNSSLIIFVRPETTEEQIQAKFSERIGKDFNRFRESLRRKV